MESDNIVKLAALQDSGKDTSATEDSMALAFAERHAETLRYVAAWGRWMFWDGSTWKPDDTRLAFDLAREMCRETADQCDPKKGGLATQLASAKTRAAVLSMASDDRRHAATAEQWDANTDVMNTQEDNNAGGSHSG